MNEDFGAITILAPKCQQCPKVKSGDHKQMAHLGYIVPQRDAGYSRQQSIAPWFVLQQLVLKPEERLMHF
jgi:hypothetical protein